MRGPDARTTRPPLLISIPRSARADGTDERHELATRSAAWLEKRLDEWESMQRERLAGRPTEEVQAAVDEGGGVEIRRLIATWSKLGTLPPYAH